MLVGQDDYKKDIKVNIYTLSDKKIEGIDKFSVFDIKYIHQNIDFRSYDALIFTSKNAVKAIDNINKEWKTKPSYAIAKKTAEVIKQYGGVVEFIGEANHGDDFAKEILTKFKDKKLLYLRASKVVSNLIEILQCDEVIIYETVCKQFSKNTTLPKNSTIIFSSPSTIQCFLKNVQWDKSFTAISIGKTTAKFFPSYIVPYIADNTSLESCVEKALEINNKAI